MATIMRMPEVLANATEAIIASWLVAEGEGFTTGQPIAEVETEKALVEVPAECDGILGKHLAHSGAHVNVGAPIAILLAKGEGQAEINELFAEIGSDITTRVPITNATQTPVIEDVTPSMNESVNNPQSEERQFASPLARRLAKENGINPAQIQGSGPGGRIVRRDVQSFLAAVGQDKKLSNAPTIFSSLNYKDIPHSPMRKAIARRLTESKATVPHFYLKAPVIAHDMLHFRARHNEWAPKKVSVTDLILKTVAAAFIDVPEANVIWMDTAIRQFNQVDVAIAVATNNGLITPVVRDINNLSLTQLNEVTNDLIERARLGRIKQNEIEGGSFSVTNLGMYGTDEFSAILNPPQSAILAVGAAIQKTVVINDAVAVRPVINFTLSVDHRAIDGALAAQWLAAFAKRFENPFWLAL